MLPNIDLWLCVCSVTVALSIALRLSVLPPLCVDIGSVCAQACDYDASAPPSLSVSNIAHFQVSVVLVWFQCYYTYTHICCGCSMTLCFSCHYSLCACVSLKDYRSGRSLSSCVLSPSQCLRKVDAAVNASPPPVWSCSLDVPLLSEATSLDPFRFIWAAQVRATGRESGMKASGRAQKSKAAKPRRCWSAALLYMETNAYWSSAARQATNQPTQPQVAQATKSQSFKYMNTASQWEKACVRVRVWHASGTSVP